MDAKEGACSLRAMADAAGIPSKRMYSLTEIARATGIPRSTLQESVRDGDLKAFMPPGRKRGMLVAPEWFDDWMERGTAWARQSWCAAAR